MKKREFQRLIFEKLSEIQDNIDKQITEIRKISRGMNEKCSTEIFGKRTKQKS
jgi:hypothetical protein